VTQTTRAPRSDARANRESILAAAREVLANDPRASIDAIARAAGLTRRALYGHFDDRGALVAELITTGAQRFNAIVQEQPSGDAPLDLARLAARLWGAAEDVQLLAAVALDDEHVASTAAALAPVRRMLVEIVRRGQSAGGLRTDMDADTLSRIIEEGARTFVTRAPSFTASVADARSIAVRAVLGLAGLSWREADALLAEHPELLTKEDAL
jgi:AcrR family transcriptional regulator